MVALSLKLVAPASDRPSSLAVPRRPETKDVHRALVNVMQRARAIDLWVYEPLSVGSLKIELVPLIARLLGDARALVERVGAAYGEHSAAENLVSAWSDPVTSVRRRTLDLVEEDGQAPETLADLTFLASLELGQREARLVRAAASDVATDILVASDSALRRVVKVLAGLESALGRAMLLEPLFDETSELDDALRTRRAVSAVRRLVIGSGAPGSAEELGKRIRLAGVALTTLMGWQAYPLLGVGDRLELGAFRTRIADWLDGEANEDEGRALFAELTRFVRSLGRINARRDLVEHDRGLVVRGLAALERVDHLSGEHLEQLRGLQGLTDAIDTLLDSSWRSLASAWRPVLERLALRFEVEG